MYTRYVKGQVPVTRCTNSNQSEFVGGVAGTKFLVSLTNMGSSHEGTCMVPGTSPRENSPRLYRPHRLYVTRKTLITFVSF